MMVKYSCPRAGMLYPACLFTTSMSLLKKKKQKKGKEEEEEEEKGEGGYLLKSGQRGSDSGFW